MSLFPLDIFPPGSLSSSVITTVWVGIWVVVFFNLRLGWVLSGLVIPGYLVPLILVKPWAAVTVTLEGIVTYLLVWFYSEVLSRRDVVSPLFGRDRFFAIILVSVLVRLLCDLWVLPVAAEAIENALGLSPDFHPQLQSFGLVIVALIANQFWKTGVVRGILPFVTTVGVTFLIVRFGLMELTNFSISNLGYLYEDVAFSIEASPKSYIILLTAAFIASRMNLRYGWDYNGILVPSLLALQWYEPLKILTSIVEGGIILAVATLLLKLPSFRQSSMEGGRKLLFFFNISFVYKMFLGFAILAWDPSLKVTDFFAFGYLLSTLMAVKAHEKGIALRLTRATLQTSLTAVVVASIVGFALTQVPDVTLGGSGREGSAPATQEAIAATLPEALRQEKVRLYEGTLGKEPLGGEERDAFERGMRALLAYARGGGEGRLREGEEHLARAGFRLATLQGRYLYLRENTPRGGGMYVIDPRSTSELVVEVPSPVGEHGSFEGGSELFQTLGARALAVAGPEHPVPVAEEGGEETLFQLFHRIAAPDNTLQVRTFTPGLVRAVSGARPGQPPSAPPGNALWITGGIPPGLNLARLESYIDRYTVHWSPPPSPNLQRDTSRRGFAELYLNREGLRKLVSRSARGGKPLQVENHPERIDGYLQARLLSGKGELALKGSGAYIPPSIGELLYLETEVLNPALRLARDEYRQGRWNPGALEDLAAVSSAAAVLGYRVTWYHHLGTGEEYLLLSEEPLGTPRRHWGTYVLRLGSRSGFLVQVPRPLADANSFEFGVSLYETLRADHLLIAGAHPRANADGSSDLLHPAGKRSLFNLASQSAAKGARGGESLSIQIRAFGGREGESPGADALVAFPDGSEHSSSGRPLREDLLAAVKRDGLSVRLVDGARETAGYESGANPQARLLESFPNHGFAVLWVSPRARQSYRQQTENFWQTSQFEALGIPSREEDPQRLMQRGRWGSAARLPEGVRRGLGDYMLRQDIVTLRRAQGAGRGTRLERIIDPNTRQAFVALYGKGGDLLALANLAPRDPEKVLTLARREDAAGTVDAFVNGRAGWLLLESAP